MSKKRQKRKVKYNPEKVKQNSVPAILKTLGAVAVRLQSKVTDNEKEAKFRSKVREFLEKKTIN